MHHIAPARLEPGVPRLANHRSLVSMPTMDLTTAAGRLGIALCLGLLVGLERQRVNHRLGGVRTFALITVFGFLCALLGKELGPWVVPAGLLATISALIAGIWRVRDNENGGPHLTTMFAAVLMFGVGAWLVVGDPLLAAVITGGLTILLHAKDRLHRIVDSLGQEDVTAIMQFILITLVILPLLPNRTFGPYDVFNPREAWILVVLIVSISLGGYLAYKLAGARIGTLLGALLGGLISSTATTVSFARRTKAGQGVGLAAMAIMFASSISALRVIGIVVLIAPAQARFFWPPLALIAMVMLLIAVVLWFTAKDEHQGATEHKNPAQLGTALTFAALYGIVLIGVEWARTQLGSGAIYGVAAVSGATDMDAISLSTARLVDHGSLAAEIGWRAILIALMANAVFKGGIAVVLGSRKLGWLVGSLFAVVISVGGIILWLWP